ncbi:MAG TPA: polysaccharide biosynthesis protein [Hungateiclostridium thermocellum]|jgi:stage V sporulation protein B|uniref:Polysaccharide biosynthesis protein n=2 Tax=Acetivibrio thermocellus TaxID=1515 RepID=A3DJY1_ACET2|nr:polysaccharide biosynthesis protein [Acetivibrio thermocellus]CDG37543.1 polysaccharide biosynthesis protein [Acetivibrio thermocellus BC1]ABN54260.1 polysaccharide biosynthesis protein [Acetivibrio thermocellus ATCC 27405]ADU73694.1 polysaccharide biosynthesis protein [Acetivibrio thermocellus DSM 1313]ALX07624.1 polysaccharide biosynthesis protein [Acetivibrio thermocellus AD2]ANV75366.1 polysaccharide biosynthesis protein [Acetivibrio thermocellus DSM 2360]
MKKQSITKGFAVLSAAGLITKILSVLYIPFLLAIIGDEGNGIYAAAYQVYVFIYVIANSGIPVAIAKSVSELTAVGNYKDALRIFKISRFFLIIIGTVLTVLMFVTAKPLAVMINSEKSFLAIAALSPTLFFTALASAYKGYFQGMSNMTPTAVSQVVEQIFNMIFTVLFAALLINKSLEAACAGGTVGTTVGALASVIVLIFIYNRRREEINNLKEHRKTAKRYSYKQLATRIFYYSLPITVCVAAQYAGNLIDVANIRGRLLAGGYTLEMASVMHSYLSKYQQIMNAPISIVSALAAAVLPSISGAAAEQDIKQVKDKSNHAFRLCMLIVIPSAVGLSILSEPIYAVLKYGAGSHLMRYGSIVLVLMSIVQIQSSILQGAGKLYKATINVILGIIAKIIFNYILIANPNINIMGAVIGSIVGYGLTIILNVMTVRKELKIKINILKQAVKPAVSSVVMGIFVWIVYKGLYFVLGFIKSAYLVNALSTVVSVLFGMAIYFYIMILVRGITKNDFDVLPEKIRRMIPKFVLNKAV